jgi:hypothetical protein
MWSTSVYRGVWISEHLAPRSTHRILLFSVLFTPSVSTYPTGITGITSMPYEKLQGSTSVVHDNQHRSVPVEPSKKFANHCEWFDLTRGISARSFYTDRRIPFNITSSRRWKAMARYYAVCLRFTKCLVYHNRCAYLHPSLEVHFRAQTLVLALHTSWRWLIHDL